MANELSKYVFNQWFLNSGAVNNAGTITVYDANTTDLSTIYSDKAGTALANPFTLAASGRMSTGDLFLPPGTYDTVIKDSAGATIDTVEDVDGPTQAGVLTEGSVIFADSNGDITQDNANLFFDDTNNRLGIGTTSPGTQVELQSIAPYITIRNTTEEDTLLGRECRIIAKGEQSGGEVTTLGYFQFSHGSNTDDEDGEFDLYLNRGSDGDSPTRVLKIDPDGLFDMGGATFSAARVNFTSQMSSAGSIFTIKGTGTADLLTVFDNTTEVFTILDGGNVGVGVTDPLERLHVNNSGTGATDHAYSFYTTGDTGETASDGLLVGYSASEKAWVWNRENTDLGFATNNTEKVNISSSGDVDIISGVLNVAGTQVISAQGAAISDASGGGTVDTEARAALNALLARVRTHGLIAT